MQSEIETRIASHGFITRPELLDLGYDDRGIHRLRRVGELVRIGPGLYTSRFYRDLRPDEQHRLRVRAVHTRFDTGDVVFSHQSAAIIHGAATWDIDLREVHLTRLDGARGRHQAQVVHHVGALEEKDVEEVNGLLVTSARRTAWDLAVTQQRDRAVVVADSLINLGLTDPDELDSAGQEFTMWTGAGRARVTLSLARPGAESPGETISRLVCHDYDLPEPVLQFKVYDEHGNLAGISDLAWPEFRHLGEFDGMVKYSGAIDLAKEKAREDLLRSLAWGISRIVWGQLTAGLQARLAEWLWEALRQSRRLYGPLAD